MYKLLINGTEYKAKANWNVSEKSGNPTSSSFTVLIESGQRIPQAEDLVEFFQGTTPVFRGICKIPKGVSFSTGNEIKEYSLNCTNYNSLLSRRLPNISYENKTLTYVVNNLFTEYIAPEGFTLGRIEVINAPVFDIYNSKEIALDKILDELAEYVDAVWEITETKIFNFYSAKTYPTKTVTLTEENAGLSALSHTRSDNDLRTRQIIEGTTLETSTQIEKFTYQPDEKGVSFTVAYPLSKTPTISINGTAVAASAIGVKGIDDSDTNKLFLWAYNSEIISVSSSYAGSISLTAGDTVAVSYKGIFDIRIEVDNDTKIAEIATKSGTTGIIENYYYDNTLNTQSDAYEKANALLLEHGEEKNTLSAKCTSEILTQCGFDYSDTAVGTLWVFNLPDLDITGEFVITERKIAANVLDVDGSYEISLKWADKDLSGGYATTLSAMETSITRLSVRKDLKIIKYINLEETTQCDEDLTVSAIIPQFCGEGIYNGQIAIPCGTLYPWVCY